MEELKDAGFWIYGGVASGGKDLWTEEYPEAAALVIGGEGRGLKRLVKQKCDVLLSIPMAGPLESLNASVAGGVLMAAFSYKFSRLSPRK
jgi:23S rRNA (guanosine2251-2'-O)-methyltransferase